MEDSGQDLYLVLFYSRRCDVGSTRNPSVQITLDVGLGELEPCWTAINHYTYAFPVALAKNCDYELLSITATGQ
jgi:hypothetical protein